MPNAIQPLILDLLEWLETGPKPLDEVLNAWQTSCPRLPIWEECNDRAFVTRHWTDDHQSIVALTSAGHAFLRQHRAPAQASVD